MATRAPAVKAGRGTCPQCREPVSFKTSAGGLLRYTCDACDTSGYAQPGGTGFAAWSKTIKRIEAEATPPDGTKPPQPAKDKRQFDLANL